LSFRAYKYANLQKFITNPLTFAQLLSYITTDDNKHERRLASVTSHQKPQLQTKGTTMQFVLINSISSNETRIPQDYIEEKINLGRTVTGVTISGAILTTIKFFGKYYMIAPYNAKRHVCFEVSSSTLVDEANFKDTPHYRALIGELLQSLLVKNAQDITSSKIIINQ
jgi:hypothetical protein